MDFDCWKDFCYEEIFNIVKGKRLTKADMIDGPYNYIGATDSNNGVTAKIGNEQYIFNGNSITVSYNGSIAEAFYQKDVFWATDDVNVLTLKERELNEFIGIFLCAIIRKEKYRFNYGRKWDKELMQISHIKLPANENHEPDWVYMESYVKTKLIPKLSQKTKAVWLNEFSASPLQEKRFSINVKCWQWFYIDKQLFDIDTGKDLIYSDLQNGDYPVIGHKATNNGVTAYTRFLDDYYLYDNNTTIALADRGNFYASVQISPFYIGTRVKALRAKFDANIYRLLFICVLINRESYKYNYGRNCCDRISSLKIKLPIDSNGNPDWQFMEDYIKSLPYSANL